MSSTTGQDPAGQRPQRTLEQRIDAVELRIRNAGGNRRQLRRRAARAEALLEVRDDAYRRLLAHNARLEADRRAIEAIDTAFTAAIGDGNVYDLTPARGAALLVVIADRLGERDLDHELVEMTAGEVDR